ncbi:alpha-tocopherol transfer protein-like isoform X2 [Thrips palmi]|nr:alpha-tocopherol transfer protein-like isoform X2 [Thrips palmi]
MTDVAVAVPSALRGKKATRVYGVQRAVQPHEIDIFRTWLKQQPHLPHDIPDETLAMFLHSQNHSLEMSKLTLDRSYSIRTAAPEIFLDRDPFAPELQDVFKIGYYSPLPARCPDGVVAFLCSIKDNDPNKFNFVNCIKVSLMVLDLVQLRDGPVPGYRLILDMKGTNIAHVAKINFATMKRALDYQQEGLPVKLKSVHVINAIPLLHQILALVKPLLKPETRNMLHVHTEAQVQKFYEYVPKELMPKEYGGDAPCQDDLNDLVKTGLEQMAPWFREEERLRVTESLRPARSRGYQSAESFGCNGSFKKLNLD